MYVLWRYLRFDAGIIKKILINIWFKFYRNRLLIQTYGQYLLFIFITNLYDDFFLFSINKMVLIGTIYRNWFHIRRHWCLPSHYFLKNFQHHGLRMKILILLSLAFFQTNVWWQELIYHYQGLEERKWLTTSSRFYILLHAFFFSIELDNFKLLYFFI